MRINLSTCCNAEAPERVVNHRGGQVMKPYCTKCGRNTKSNWFTTDEPLPNGRYWWRSLLHRDADEFREVVNKLWINIYDRFKI